MSEQNSEYHGPRLKTVEVNSCFRRISDGPLPKDESMKGGDVRARHNRAKAAKPKAREEKQK